MLRALSLLVLAAIVVTVAWYVGHLPGQFVLHFGRYVVQTSVPVALLALAVLFLVLYALARFVSGLLRIPQWFGVRGALRQRRRGDEAVTRSLLALAAGDGTDAQRESARSRRLLGDTPQTLLLAAQAARIAGHEDQAEAIFRELAERKDAGFLGLRGLLRQALARQDWVAAAEYARRAEAAHPGAAWLRTERAQIAIQTQDWRGALSLSAPDAPLAAFATAAALEQSDPDEGRKLAKSAWEADPSLAPAAIAYARRLREQGKEAKAIDVLRRSWSLAPHPDVAAYAIAPANGALERLAAAESMVGTTTEHHAETHLLLARLHLDAGQIAAARTELDRARAGGLDQQRVWLLQADIAEAEGQADEAREALRHATTAPSDPVWRCGSCGTVHVQWLAVCPQCRTPGRIVWGTTRAETALVAV
ncbi:MAG: heme biosynthesis HemY N-terminal domain-containing protein [Janthinobacterium lividum]